MSINPDFWLKPFPKDHFPNWNCPKCPIGILRPLEKTFSFEESGDITVERLRNGEYFDYDVYTFRYSVLLKCNNRNCQERVSSCGHGYVREDLSVINGAVIQAKDGSPEIEWVEVFVPEYFYPAINLFAISKEYPEEVINEIKSSLSCFFQILLLLPTIYAKQ